MIFSRHYYICATVILNPLRLEPTLKTLYIDDLICLPERTTDGKSPIIEFSRHFGCKISRLLSYIFVLLRHIHEETDHVERKSIPSRRNSVDRT